MKWLSNLWQALKKAFTSTPTPVVETPKEQVKPIETPDTEVTSTSSPNWSVIAKNIKLDTDADKQAELQAICNKIIQNSALYYAVEKVTKVPAKLVAAIHYMESSLNFKTILHNGTPLGQVSKIVPVGVKFDNWHDAAVDALTTHGALKITDWSFANMLAFAERYNGLGYRKHGIYSNYVVSYTNFSDEIGRYVADGKFDQNSAHKRAGVAAIILKLNEIEQAHAITPTQPVVEKPVEQTEQDLKWMTIAKKEIGQHEISGAKHNARIVEYHQTTTLKATTDEVYWCASFMSWVFVIAKMISKKSARAKDWLEWGIKLDKPKYGCVVVFTRNGGGHVALFISEDATHVTVLGGNQSDSVCIAKYPKTEVIGYRWPQDA